MTFLRAKVRITVLVVVLAASGMSIAQTIEQKVDEVLSRPQLEAGQYTQWFVELGNQAVPILCKRLPTERFPLTFIRAFAELKDKRATIPIVEFITGREPHSGDGDVLVILAIRALKEIGDQRSVIYLNEWMNSDSAHMRIRLAAAEALARIGKQEYRERAIEFVDFCLENGHIFRTGDPNERILDEDLDRALIEVDTEESLAILLEGLNHDPAPSESPRIIEYLKNKDREDVREVLYHLTDDNEQEPHIRVLALVAIAAHANAPRAEIAVRLESLSKLKLIPEAQVHVRNLMNDLNATKDQSN